MFWHYMALGTFYHHDAKQSQLHLKLNSFVYALSHQQRHVNRRLVFINNVKLLVLNFKRFFKCFFSCFLHTFWCSIKICNMQFIVQITITRLRHRVHIHTTTKVQNCLMSLSSFSKADGAVLKLVL